MQDISSTRTVTGWRRKLVRIRLRSNILRIALSVYGNPLTAIHVLISLLRKMKSIMGFTSNPRLIKANGRYFWTLSSVGWPGPAFDKFIRNELHKIRPMVNTTDHLQTIIFSITSRCPLQCDHCYEWNNLTATETLSLDNLKEILQKFQAYGICNIQFSGGEPLSRFEDLIQLLKAGEKSTDHWILTSGFGLTAERAKQLQQAGLTGVVISLDHWDAVLHNAFRKNENSFYWVKEAARNAREVDLAVAFSLCAGKDFVSRANLVKYLQLAKDSGAAIVRILEPREVGHYEGKDMELDAAQIRILNDFYLSTLSSPEYKYMPIVEYPGYHQRKCGCFGAGDRYLYVDSKGDIHACPFCQNPVGNALEEPLADSIARLKQAGCHKFHTKVPETELR